MKELKNIDFWEDFALGDTPESYKKWFEAERKYLRNVVTKGASVLDVACGKGRNMNDIVDITDNLVGIDHEKKAIEDAKNNFKDYPRVKFLLADAKKLPFENDRFDFVICMASFANFGDYKIKALNEMKRVVKKSGLIILSVFSEDAFEERIELYKKANAPIKKIKGTTVIFDEMSDNVSEQFSKKELEDLFEQAGLKILDIKKVSIAYVCKAKKK